ncbi:MAG: RnfABCDGE type electron transport complex subunit D, partial [Bacteroidales bacterium]|nr:RnfABCDGE type electron transport complex subunit D [Bacteroidales bacterium]
MADNKLAIAMSPHVHGNESVKKIMFSVIIALLPAFCVSVYFFGLNAIRVTLISIISCVAVEWLIQKFLLKGKCTICDGSAILTGLLLAFNVPANLDWWILVIGAIVAIGIAKMTFGGLGNNPFNPALVGRVFLLISFPSQMTTWPTPEPIWNISALDGVTGPTVLGILNEEGAAALSNPNYMDLLVGNMGGSLGEMSAIALLIGGIFLLIRKVITWHIPV